MDICRIVPKGSTLHLPRRGSPAWWGYAYLEHIGCDETSFRRIDEYLKLIKARATGHQLTPATWMRNFVHSHRDYKSLGCQGTWLAVGGHCHRSTQAYHPRGCNSTSLPLCSPALFGALGCVRFPFIGWCGGVQKLSVARPSQRCVHMGVSTIGSFEGRFLSVLGSTFPTH